MQKSILVTYSACPVLKHDHVQEFHNDHGTGQLLAALRSWSDLSDYSNEEAHDGAHYLSNQFRGTATELGMDPRIGNSSRSSWGRRIDRRDRCVCRLNGVFWLDTSVLRRNRRGADFATSHWRPFLSAPPQSRVLDCLGGNASPQSDGRFGRSDL